MINENNEVSTALLKANYRPADGEDRCRTCAHVKREPIDSDLPRCKYHSGHISLDNTCDNHTPPLCDNCIGGRGKFITGGEDADFHCHGVFNIDIGRNTRPRPDVTPDTPGCEHHVAVLRGYRERVEDYKRFESERAARRYEENWPAFDPEVDLTQQQLQDDADESRRYNRALGYGG